MSVAKPRGETGMKFSVPVNTPPSTKTSITWKKNGDPDEYEEPHSASRVSVAWTKDGAMQKLRVMNLGIDPGIGPN